EERADTERDRSAGRCPSDHRFGGLLSFQPGQHGVALHVALSARRNAYPHLGFDALDDRTELRHLDVAVLDARANIREVLCDALEARGEPRGELTVRKISR